MLGSKADAEGNVLNPEKLTDLNLIFNSCKEKVMTQRLNVLEVAQGAMKAMYGLEAYLAKHDLEASLFHLLAKAPGVAGQQIKSTAL